MSKIEEVFNRLAVKKQFYMMHPSLVNPGELQYKVTPCLIMELEQLERAINSGELFTKTSIKKCEIQCKIDAYLMSIEKIMETVSELRGKVKQLESQLKELE